MEGDLQLSLDWFDIPSALDAVLEFINCSCRGNCVAPDCQCAVKELACTELCHPRQCNNHKEDLPDEEETYSSDEDDDEDYDYCVAQIPIIV